MKKLLLSFTLAFASLIPLSGISQTVVTVGSGTACTGSYPINSFWEDNRTGIIYSAADILAAGGYPGSIQELAIDVCTSNGTYDGYTIKMGTTSQTALTNFITSNVTTVYTVGNFAPTTGWQTFPLTTPFIWNGTDNIYVEICWNNNAWGSSSTVRYSTTSTNTVWSRFTDGAIGCSLTGGTSYNQRPNMQFNFLPASLTAVLPDTIALSCYGDSAATLAPLVVGGSYPYTYDWSNGSTDSAQFNMPAGNYSVIVTDDSNDMDTAFVVVTQPDSISLNANVTTPLVCNYDVSEAMAMGSGGSPWGTYAWDTSMANYAWDSSANASVVTFPGNNTVSQDFDIGFDFVFFGQSYDEFKMASNGFISFDAIVDNGCCDGDPIPNNSTFEPNNAIYAMWEYFNASFGEYSYYTEGEAPNRRLVVNFIDMPICCGSTPTGSAQIIMHETSNCIEIQTEFWNQQTFGTVTQGIENAAGTEAFTYPGRNGTQWSTSGNTYIQFCPSDSAGLVYEWSNGYIGNHAIGLDPGTYTITATDANGCNKTTSLTIDPPASDLQSALDVEDVSCYSFNDATVDPAITGGSGAVTYDWNNGATSPTLTNVGPGMYSITAEDALNCTLEVNNIMVTEPEILLGSIYGVQNVVCESDMDGSASVSVSGGTPPYSPVWSNGNVGMSATGLSAGQNNVVVTDSNGCQVVVPVNILFDFPAPQPELGNNIMSTNGNTVTLTTAPNTYASYTWSTGATSTTIDVTETGNYWVEVATGNGCIGSDSIYVEVWPTGIEEMNTLTGVEFYPNPARDQITFEINSEIKELNVSITDAKGSIVASESFLNGGMATLDVSALPAGVYSLSMMTDELNATQQLVITK